MSNPYIGDPNSVAIMSKIDRMRKELRALVHEYGFVVVAQSIDDAGGPNNVSAKALRADLHAWRERLQEKLLGGA